MNTAIELGFLMALTTVSLLLPSSVFDVSGSMRLSQLSAFLWAFSLVRRFYNTYLEAIYFTFPELRTRPPGERVLKDGRDLNGRDEGQLNILIVHDRCTLIMYNTLALVLYYTVPGFYPAVNSPLADNPLFVRAARLVAHHYLLSFGMYWAHRSLHTVPLLWRRIHRIHHWARRPLSRNTYQDHWLENFGNAILGEVAARLELPRPGFWVSSAL